MVLFARKTNENNKIRGEAPSEGIEHGSHHVWTDTPPDRGAVLVL